MASPPRLLSALPAFVTTDVRAAVAFYRDKLGFHVPQGFEAADGFAIVDLAPGQGIHLKRGPAAGAAARRMGAYVRMGFDELARCERLFSHRGVRIVSPLYDHPWGMRELVVEDPDGHQVRFGSDIDQTAPQGIVTVSPEIPVGDPAAAAAYCRDVLGFLEFGDPDAFPNFRMVRREGVVLQWAGGRGPIPRNRGRAEIWDAAIEVTGIDALAAELAGRGVTVQRGPVTAEYGMRELEIAGPEGCTLCFAEDLEQRS
jgi:catechol 2,3-dioxygenase-like lactoylglutathione lyase family enzyme